MLLFCVPLALDEAVTNIVADPQLDPPTESFLSNRSQA